MAVIRRKTYSILVENKQALQCCEERKKSLARKYYVIEMGYAERVVSISDLAHCNLCGLGCLYKESNRDLS